MKKIISLLIVLCMAFSLVIPASAASTEEVDITYRAIRIVLEGEEITPCDEKGNTVAPFIMNSTGTTYLPLRAIAQALGLNVKWIAETSTVELTSGGEVKTGAGKSSDKRASETATITYRGINVTLDGAPLKLVNAAGESVEPFILAGTTYLPLRIIGEALGLDISWDAKTSTVGLKQAEGWWMRTGEKYTSYDEQGKIIYGYATENKFHPNGEMSEYIYTTSDGFRDINKYDENGRFIYSESGSGDEISISENAYDADGRIIYSKYTTPHDGYSSETWTTYDANGREASKRILVKYEGGINDYTVSYTYNGNVRTGTYKYVDGSTADDEITTYTYDSKGNLVKVVTDYGSYSTTEEYAYDANGSQIASCYSDSDGFYSKSSWILDSKGRISEEIYEENYSGSVNKQIWKYTRDERGITTYLAYSCYKDGEWTNGWTRAENYDANGLYLGYDYKEGDVTETVTVIYGSNGRVSSAVMENNRGKTVFSFTFDANGNIVKAVGNCDDGGEEVYEFSYTLMK